MRSLAHGRLLKVAVGVCVALVTRRTCANHPMIPHVTIGVHTALSRMQARVDALLVLANVLRVVAFVITHTLWSTANNGVRLREEAVEAVTRYNASGVYGAASVGSAGRGIAWVTEISTRCRGVMSEMGEVVMATGRCSISSIVN